MSAYEMLRQTEELLERLMAIAQGDSGLVIEAFREAGPRLEDIVAHVATRATNREGA